MPHDSASFTLAMSAFLQSIINRIIFHSIAMRLKMNRNILLYGIICALAITAGVLGYQYYKEQQKPSGVEINIGKRGITIEEK